MRVARGSPWSLMMTTAFSSNRMYEPSFRRVSLAVRTTTARATSDFFTVPFGRAFLTATITTSPRPAYRRRVPPSTRMTCAVFAPELSATFTIDSCWIIDVSDYARLTSALDDLDDTPPLVLRQRPRLGDTHGIAGL